MCEMPSPTPSPLRVEAGTPLTRNKASISLAAKRAEAERAAGRDADDGGEGEAEAEQPDELKHQRLIGRRRLDPREKGESRKERIAKLEAKINAKAQAEWQDIEDIETRNMHANGNAGPS